MCICLHIIDGPWYEKILRYIRENSEKEAFSEEVGVLIYRTSTTFDWSYEGDLKRLLAPDVKKLEQIIKKALVNARAAA